MNRKYKELIKYLNDGKNLEEVLPEYAIELSGLLYEYSLLQSALEFYNLKEMLEETNEVKEDTLPITSKLGQWIGEVFQTEESGEFREVHIRQIDGMRTEIMDKMDYLTMYADQLQIYEYVLNRKELEFEAAKESIPDDVFSQRLYQFIFANKDNILINQRIQEAVGQLPLRMHKAKFFEYLKDSLNCYKDADKSSVDTFIYMLKTSAMIYQPQKTLVPYTYINDRLRTLREANYTSLKKEEFEECCKVLKDTASKITILSDFNYQIEKVINNLYILLLVRPYVLDVDRKLQHSCIDIITSTLECLDTSYNACLEEKIGKLFDELLGIQEQHIEDYQYFSGGLSIIKEVFHELVDSMALSTHIECLNLADKLSGNSVFADIHKEEQEDRVAPDYIEKQLQHLINELTDFFKNNPQCINRAVMAAVLSKLPVFFNNSTQVKEYIANSLSQCQNEAEKSVAKELLLSLMAAEEY